LPPGDRQRLLRAWEVVAATGRPLAEWQRRGPAPAPLRIATALIMPPREALYAACDRRFEAMIAAGALDEARALAARNLPPDLPAMKAVGVPELMRHLRGDIALDEAILRAKRATRRYAKRQMTWFRHQIVADLVFDQPFSPPMLRQANDFIDQFLLTHRT
jgi:tRNA dimethylallyltransferase